MIIMVIFINNCLFLLVYIYVLPATSPGIVTSIVGNRFTLRCTTNGAPSSISWSYVNGSVAFEGDTNLHSMHYVKNSEESIYESLLTFENYPSTTEFGQYVCISTFKYIESSNSKDATTVSAVKGDVIIVMVVLNL